MNINQTSRSETKSKTNRIVMSIENSSKHHPFFVIYKKNHVSRKQGSKKLANGKLYILYVNCK
jgi:hypothetical protein